MEIFQGEAIFPTIRSHWGKGGDQEMSSVPFPRALETPLPDLWPVSPLPSQGSWWQENRKGGAFIPCLKVQACSLLRTLGSSICPVSMAMAEANQGFLGGKAKGIPKAVAVGLNYPLSQMQHGGAICRLPVVRDGGTQETA